MSLKPTPILPQGYTNYTDAFVDMCKLYDYSAPPVGKLYTADGLVIDPFDTFIDLRNESMRELQVKVGFVFSSNIPERLGHALFKYSEKLAENNTPNVAEARAKKLEPLINWLNDIKLLQKKKGDSFKNDPQFEAVSGALVELIDLFGPSQAENIERLKSVGIYLSQRHPEVLQYYHFVSTLGAHVSKYPEKMIKRP